MVDFSVVKGITAVIFALRFSSLSSSWRVKVIVHRQFMGVSPRKINKRILYSLKHIY